MTDEPSRRPPRKGINGDPFAPKTSRGKTYNLVRKHTKPPADQGGFAWLTRDFMESVAYRTLSGNALKALARLQVEHVSHGALHNGKLVVTHGQFIDYGVTGEYVADAIDELEYKGIIRRHVIGRAGNGTAHPNTFRLTFTGDYEGATPTHDWKRCTEERAKAWSETVRRQMADRRRKKKSPLRKSEMRPLRDSEIREVS